ncbi:hypothetical protein N6B72_16980 [Chryseobacterium soli]|uniref:RHS repeat-associated core domain-containing protein n=1 Tax=Chryseobacterium soli TaxID=445961 RepID=UPI0029547ED8|nr:RHS repeat-associated core domain-containing protein [Chryseobacterium soli]MDV7698622.1 hypothetical protein [Chryseobacterium soli]
MVYDYKNHLGNVRISFARNTGTGGLEITDANDYYPFGMSHLKTGNAYFGAGKYQNYKYNGKELQETGMYDYGARMYMPDIGRWGVVDPLAENAPNLSPFRYGYNNPITFSDPTGMLEDIYEVDNDGNLTWKAESDRDVIYGSKNFDSSGNLKTENDGGVDVGEKGFIAKNSDSQEVKLLDVGKTTTETYDYIKFGNDGDKAQKVFNYLAENTNVEFNRNVFTNSRNDKFSFVGTIHKEDKVPLVNLGATLIESEHNHPDPITFWPSGFNVDYSAGTGKFNYSRGLPTGDIKAAESHPNAKFLLYAPNYPDGALRINFDGQKIISITNQGKK